MKLARERGQVGAADVMAAREDERRLLARELHDGPAQSLAAALFGVDLALGALARAPATAGDELRAARVLVRDALDDVRALMTGLRPRLLEEHGLLAALQALIANLDLWGPDVTLETRGIAGRDRLPPGIELALFRTAQETLSNARRHARATRVVMTLAIEAGVVSLVVADDGGGFTSEVAGPVDRGEGLRGMRERARRLGGECLVTSVPGEGTRVDVTVPLSPSDNGVREREGDW